MINAVEPIREYYGNDKYLAYLINRANADEKLLRETQPIFAMPPPPLTFSSSTIPSIQPLSPQEKEVIKEVPAVERYASTPLKQRRGEQDIGNLIDLLV